MKPINMNLKTYVRRKLVTVSELPEKEARDYDTALMWAFFKAAK